MADLATQITQIFNSSNKGRTLAIAGVLVVAMVGFGYLIFWNNQPDYRVLYSNLSPEDAGEILAKLKEKKTPYQLAGNGTTILVPRDQVYDNRITLAADGLPKGGGVGFEVFDRTNLGATDFVQKLNYQRALQGELSRTIRQIKEIEQARVHIVTPKESLFVEEQKKPTASVFVKTRSGMSLAPNQVEGIVHLVASAIEGLDPGNITVVDTTGKILSKRVDSSPIGQMTTGQLEYQRNVEEELKKRIQGMLEGVLGVDKAIARVSTDIDFQEVNIIEESYDPKSVIRSEQSTREKSTSSSRPPLTLEKKEETAPGPKDAKGKPNSPLIPGRKSSTNISSPPTNESRSERQNDIRNYEISKINKQIRNPVGNIKKISVAVIVDGTYKEFSGVKGRKEKRYAPRKTEEMKNLETIVKRAIGYDEKRGDQVEVINMPFNWPQGEEEIKPEKEESWKEYTLDFYKPIVSLLLALLFIFFVVKPLLKKKPALPGRGDIPLLPQGEEPMAPQRILQEASPPKALDIRDQTVHLLKEDPAKSVGIVKAWLRERE
jgi:flagellar M-ring protein FliF